MEHHWNNIRTWLLLALLIGCGDTGAASIPAWEPPPGDLDPPTATQPPVFRGRVPVLAADAPPLEVLATVRAFGDTAAFGHIMSMLLVPGGLLVVDRVMSPHVALVDVTSGQVLNRFGSHGTGPGEFRQITWMMPHAPDPELFWLYDSLNRRYSLVRPQAERHSAIVAEMPLGQGEIMDRPLWLGDRIMGSGSFADFTFLITDASGNEMARIVADPPFTEQQLPHSVARRLLNRNFLAVSPSRERIVLAYQFANRLDFFTSAGERYGTVPGPRATTPRFHIRDDGRFYWEAENEMAYFDVVATERFVYALFCGCQLQDNGPPSRLHVFRWDGDFAGELALDQPVFSITVTPDDTAIFGAIEDPYPRLGQWLLPDWLRAESGTAGEHDVRGAN